MVSPSRLRIVATNALRQAKNADDFIQRANAILPNPLEVIRREGSTLDLFRGVAYQCQYR